MYNNPQRFLYKKVTTILLIPSFSLINQQTCTITIFKQRSYFMKFDSAPRKYLQLHKKVQSRERGWGGRQIKCNESEGHQFVKSNRERAARCAEESHIPSIIALEFNLAWFLSPSLRGVHSLFAAEHAGTAQPLSLSSISS